MFADTTGGKLFYSSNMLDTASHYLGCFSSGRQDPIDGFLWILAWFDVSRLVSLNVSGSIWEASSSHPSVAWLSKLDVDSCQRLQYHQPRTLHVERAGGAWKYRVRPVVDQFSTKLETIFRQNCGFVQSSIGRQTQRSEKVDM